MNKKDRIHTTFITKKGVYYYKVMSFGLKNARATYQRLINNMFFKLMGFTVKAYIEDMLIKSKEAKNYIRDANKVFKIFK